MVASRLEKQLGVKVRIDGSRSSWNGDITLTGITAGDGAKDETAAVRIEELRLDISPSALIRGDLRRGVRGAAIRDWRVRMSLDDAGLWHPSWLSGTTEWLGRWGSLAVPAPEQPEAAAATAATAHPVEPGASALILDDWDRTAISLEDGTMEWIDETGRVVAFVHQVSFTRTPLDLPTRQAGHYHLRVAAALAGPTQVRDLDVELLRTGDSYLVLNLEAVRQPAGAPPLQPRNPSAANPAPRSEPPPDRRVPAPDRAPAPPPSAGDAATAPAADPMRHYLQEELAGALAE